MSRLRKAIVDTTPLTSSSSIGQLLRAQIAMQNNIQAEDNKPKTVGFNENENMRLYELYSGRREEYHSTRPSGQRNEEVPMDVLAREWAIEITAMGFAERTPAQIKQRIRDMRKFSRKHAHKLGITNLTSGQEMERYAEFSWAEPKRRSRGPVPHWMSGLAHIMMNEKEKNAEDSEATSDVMDAAYGPKSKRLKMAIHEQQMQQLQHQMMEMKQREMIQQCEMETRMLRDLSPESALHEKKNRLADAKLETEKLKQQALRLEILYYHRQLSIFDEPLIPSPSEITSTSSPNELLRETLSQTLMSD